MPTTDHRPSRPRFGAAYWLAMVLSVVLILAGAIVGFLGPKLFPPHHLATRPADAGLATRPGPAK